MTVLSDISTVEADIKPALQRIKAAAQRYFLHASGQAIALFTVATHDVSKWETAAAVGGTGLLTSAIKRVSAWLAK